jgi:hypothetical protein
MSWSDDPTARAGGQRPQWRQLAELDLALRLPRQTTHSQEWPGRVHSGQPESPAGQAAPAYPSPSAPQPISYHYPQRTPSEVGQGIAGATSGAQLSAFVPRSAPQGGVHTPYAPQFDRNWPIQPQGFNGHGGPDPARGYEQSAFAPGAHNAGLPPLQSGPATPGPRQSLAGGPMNQPHPELRGPTYDQWPAMQDPSTYDLGSYMPSGSGDQRGYDAYQPNGRRPALVDPHWPEGDGVGGHAQDPSVELANYHDPYRDNEPLFAAGQPQDHEDTDYELEEPRRGYRGLAIAAALVGAIASGGGLAYAYKTLIGPPSASAPPVVRADSRPAKTQPADPGGKQFAHQGKQADGPPR